MVKNGILNIMKYIFLVALVSLLSFSFTGVDCFAQTWYVQNANGTIDEYTCVDEVFVVLWPNYDYTSTPNRFYYGIREDSISSFSVAIYKNGNKIFDYNRAGSVGGFWIMDYYFPRSSSFVVPGLSFYGIQGANGAILNSFSPIVPEFKEDLYNFNCSVSFVSSQYQSGALFTVYGANEVFDTLEYIDLKIEGNGSVTHRLHFNNFLIGANVPGLGFAYTYVFDPSAYLTDDGVFWWSARGYDSDGNWGVDYAGACNFNQTLSIVPGSSEFIKPSSPGGQLMEGIQHQSTYKITNNNSGSISSAITTGSKIKDYDFYSYDIQEGDTQNFNDVVNNDYSSTNTYKDFNFDFGDINIDTGSGTNFGFDSLKSFFNGEFKGRSANVVSWFQNIFPFFPSEFLNTIAWVIGIFLALVVVLIAIKIIGLIL